MGREEMQQVLRVPKREGWEPKANSDEEQEASRLTALPTKVRACTHRDVSQAI